MIVSRAKCVNWKVYVYSTRKSFLVILIPFVMFTVLIFGQIHCWKNVMFTVLSFGQLTNIFGILYLVILQGQIWSSFFGHLNNPLYKAFLLYENMKIICNIKKYKIPSEIFCGFSWVCRWQSNHWSKCWHGKTDY